MNDQRAEPGGDVVDTLQRVSTLIGREITRYGDLTPIEMEAVLQAVVRAEPRSVFIEAVRRPVEDKRFSDEYVGNLVRYHWWIQGLSDA